MLAVLISMLIFTALAYFQCRNGAFRCLVKRHKRRYFRAGVKNNGRRTVRILLLALELPRYLQIFFTDANGTFFVRFGYACFERTANVLVFVADVG